MDFLVSGIKSVEHHRKTFEMCQETNNCINRLSLYMILIPFVLGGIAFSILGINHLDTLPNEIVSPLDRAYTISVAFVDMGSFCAVVCFTSLSLFRKFALLVGRLRRGRKHGDTAAV